MVTAIVSIIMFLVMVSLHEFGHFIVAKILNFKVDEFSVGMGPLIFKRKKGETQYSIRALPLGGYCKFEGEDDSSDNPRAFTNQKPWKRLLVLVAGGVFNVILGFALFLVILPVLSPVSTNVVDKVVEHSYIEEAGIMPGDEIIKLNGKNIDTYNDINLYKSTLTSDKDSVVVIKRDGEKLEFTFRPSLQTVTTTYTEEGIKVDNTINGYTTGSFTEYSEDIPKNESLIGQSETVKQYIIGFYPAAKHINFFNIWGEGINETKFVVKLVYQSLWQIATGKIGVEEMSGPVGIVSEVNTAVNSGRYSWLSVINLAALLTINLGIFNLLPLPALDGGRILFVLVELVRRKPVPPEKEGIVHGIGLLLLLLFAVFVSYHDIIRLIS